MFCINVLTHFLSGLIGKMRQMNFGMWILAVPMTLKGEVNI